MMIKIRIFSCLVTIALSSTAGVLANVIPSSGAGMNSDMSHPAFAASILQNPRNDFNDAKGAISDAIPDPPSPPALPVPVPSPPALPVPSAPSPPALPVPVPTPSAPPAKRGFFERFRSADFFHSKNVMKRDVTFDIESPNFTTPALQSRGEDRDNDNNDIGYLNLALLLSQLEYAFFDNGLNRFSEADFRAAGYADWVRGRFEQIREHEKAHVEFLQSAVTTSGRERVLPCDYVFNLQNVRVFVDIGYAITTIAASGYIGGLHYFRHEEYITILASILAVESRQASWINSAVRKQNPWNTAFETPLTPNQVVTLLSEFFDYDNMPAQNRGLLPPGLRPYPRLNLAPRLVPGEEAEISFPYSRQQEGEHLYAAFLVGFETIFVVVNERQGNGGEHHDGNGENRNRFYVTIPRDLSARGTVYVSIVRGRDNINNVRFDDASIVAGPAIALFPFDAHGKPINSCWYPTTTITETPFSCKPPPQMAPKYELLPSSPVSSRPDSPSYLPPYEEDQENPPFQNDIEGDAPRRPIRRREPIPALDSDPRFRARTPSPYARAGLIIFMCFLFWLAFAMRKAMWVAGGMGMPTVVPEVDPSY